MKSAADRKKLLKAREKLLAWFRDNRRDLPWRASRDPYRTWISEVMLQQTQVSQVIPYYHQFIDTFPDIFVLAAAPLHKVLKVWEGMGYYARARNLHRAAKIIVVRYNGQIPEDKTVLLQLPGFGPYITNAVLSLVYQQPYAVTDGNVIRVISRLFGVEEDIRLAATRNKINRLVTDLLDKSRPGLFNEALMELGALLCLSGRPKCDVCPFRQVCVANRMQLWGKFPVKTRKPPKPVRTVTALLLTRNSKILIARRENDGLLGGLWEFPVLNNSFPRTEDGKYLISEKFNRVLTHNKSWPAVRHSYTHFNLILYPEWYQCHNTDISPGTYAEFKWVNWKDVYGYPTHKAVQKIMQILETDSEFISQGQIENTIL
jgi:A/G-specific adenine glycosylase